MPKSPASPSSTPIGGLRQLILTVENRSLRPGSNLYLATAPTGQALAGNVGSLAPGVLDKNGWSETTYRRLDEQDAAEHRALVRVVQLTGGFRLLVGRDLEEQQRMRAIIVAAARGSVALVIVLGLAGGFFVTRRVLRRFDAMTETSQRIMEGDLSGRLPVTGTGDEVDRLAMNLNVMLERIEALMHGLKEVSDNIAHDLKTPLTRLRNRCEDALRTAKSEADYRAALHGMTEESDGLIRTFDALLMIARAESGQARDNMIEFDAAEIVNGVAELYEPVAEEKGLALKVDAPEPARIKGNRELLSQALANLIDNAIKYAQPAPGAAGEPPEILLNGSQRGRPRPDCRGGSRPRDRGSRPKPRGRAVRAPAAKPGRTGFGIGPEPRGRRRASAWRRTDIGGQRARPEGGNLAAETVSKRSACGIRVHDGRAGETRRQEEE